MYYMYVFTRCENSDVSQSQAGSRYWMGKRREKRVTGEYMGTTKEYKGVD